MPNFRTVLVDDVQYILVALQRFFAIAEGFEIVATFDRIDDAFGYDWSVVDLVISDFKDPRSQHTGLNLLRSARQANPRLATVLFTATEYRRLGVVPDEVCVIAKPANMDYFLKVVRAHLTRSPA